ncbi:MAG: hypothetical protein R3F62_27680 [Planctomycetota bacterium]
MHSYAPTAPTAPTPWRYTPRAQPGQPPKPREPEPFLDQVAYFKERYPEGFQDPNWLRDQRGRDASKVLKRHREPALNAAREHAARLPGLLAAGDEARVLRELHELLGATSLVPLKQVRRLEHLVGPAATAVARAWGDLVQSDALELEPFVSALASAGLPASWPLVTAPIALVRPHAAAFVQVRLLQKQAKRLGSQLRLTSLPQSERYRAACELVVGLRGRLRKAGLEAQDLFDVTDFAWATLRPMAQATLDGAHRRRLRRERDGEAA